MLDDESREVAGEVAALLLLEEDPDDVLRLVLQRGLGEVDDREAHRRELRRHRVDRVRHQEPDPHHEVEVLLGEARQVRDVVRVLMRLEHAPAHAELLLRTQQADVVEVVERPVVQPADVGNQAHLDLLAAGRRRAGGARRPAAALRARAAAPGCDERQRENEGD